MRLQRDFSHGDNFMIHRTTLIVLAGILLATACTPVSRLPAVDEELAKQEERKQREMVVSQHSRTMGNSAQSPTGYFKKASHYAQAILRRALELPSRIVTSLAKIKPVSLHHFTH